MHLAPPDSAFEQWLRETGEQPPDFAKLPAHPDLPPLLTMADGRPVDSPERWRERQRELRGLLEHWFWGTFPTTPPRLKSYRVVSEGTGSGCTWRKVELIFACPPAARGGSARPAASTVTFHVRVLTPDGGGPFPVFLCTSSSWTWAATAVTRGYLCCVYPGADNDDKSRLFAPVYPACDWRTIPLRAWLVGRVLDYLLSLPEANPEQVCLSAHSRDGKQALVAAAIEPRISAVAASRSGSGGAAPFRFSSEREYQESVEALTWIYPHWFHPRLRFFTGREQHLPTDTHAYYALIAPRPCLIGTATGDGTESTFAVERGFRAAQEVYRFLDRPEAICLRYGQRGREIGLDDLDAHLDWFDLAFGRGHAEFPKKLLHGFDRGAWEQAAPPAPAPPPATDRESARAAISWSLGEQPPAFTLWGSFVRGKGPEEEANATMRLPLSVSEYAQADLVYPRDATGPLTTVIWLHPFSFPWGRSGAYTLDHKDRKRYSIMRYLAKHGIACLAMDQLGFGGRVEEGAGFYRRYPRWSKLGKMVHDARAAVRLVSGELTDMRRQHYEPPALDPNRIYLLGYALGGMVALHAAALDERVAGVASFGGLYPMRADDGARTGGLRRWTDWYGLQPRLGEFVGREAELPYDYDDLLRLVAPRPCLVVSPEFDRDADPAAVTACVARARPAWEEAGAGAVLTHLTPRDYSLFQPLQFEVFKDWLVRLPGSRLDRGNSGKAAGRHDGGPGQGRPGRGQ